MKIDWGTIKNEAEQAVGFPAHGWARTTFDAKVLWLPVKGAFTTWHWRERGGLPSRVPLAQAVASFDAFYRTLHDLGVVLRELHRFQRLLSGLSKPLEELDADTLNRTGRLQELARPALDLAYVYLRRLANRFADAARYLLFAHPQSAPREFKTLRKTALSDEKLCKPGLLCAPEALRKLFTEHCVWFERLRGDGLRDEHGPRDLLEHHPVRLDLQTTWVGDGPPQVEAHIVRLNPIRIEPELFASLRDIVAGLCAFWSQVLPLMETRTAYERYDWFLLHELDEDSTGFWPEIKAATGARI